MKKIETNNINILLEPLLFNIKVKILNKYELCKTLYEKKLISYCPWFVDTQDEFISYERITNDYSIKISFTTNESLKQAIICARPNVKQFSLEVLIKPFKNNLFVRKIKLYYSLLNS